MSTATKKNPPTIPAEVEHVVTLTAAQVAQHPDNLRDPGRDIDQLAASIADVGVLVPLIVVPVDQVPGEWPKACLRTMSDAPRRPRNDRPPHRARNRPSQQALTRSGPRMARRNRRHRPHAQVPPQQTRRSPALVPDAACCSGPTFPGSPPTGTHQ